MVYWRRDVLTILVCLCACDACFRIEIFIAQHLHVLGVPIKRLLKCSNYFLYISRNR